MTDVKTNIEAAANRWMQTWFERDLAVLEDCLSADFSPGRSSQARSHALARRQRTQRL